MAIRKRRGSTHRVSTQMGMIGDDVSAENEVPIREFVPLASLDNLVFGVGIFAMRIVMNPLLRPCAQRSRFATDTPELEQIRPMKGVFDQHYVRNLTGSWIKNIPDKYHMWSNYVRIFASSRPQISSKTS